jgi:hypothetical protein
MQERVVDLLVLSYEQHFQRATQAWLNRHYAELVRDYPGKALAINPDGILEAVPLLEKARLDQISRPSAYCGLYAVVEIPEKAAP